MRVASVASLQLENTWLSFVPNDLQVACVRREHLVHSKKPTGQFSNHDDECRDDFSFEALCIFLERALSTSASCCSCCSGPDVSRCYFCANAVGWHRCMNCNCTDLSDVSAFKWAKNSLYNPDGYDVDMVVLDMLEKGTNTSRIETMLGNLLSNQLVSESKHAELGRYLKARNGVAEDDGLADIITFLQNGTPAFAQPTREELLKELSDVEGRLQNYWDFGTGAYKRYDEFEPPRTAPSQFLALQQLRYRYQQGAAICVALVAPAGYGKSDLLKAWELEMRLAGTPATVLGPTGIAASNCGGSTIHSFLYLGNDGVSKLMQSQEKENS